MQEESNNNSIILQQMSHLGEKVGIKFRDVDSDEEYEAMLEIKSNSDTTFQYSNGEIWVEGFMDGKTYRWIIYGSTDCHKLRAHLDSSQPYLPIEWGEFNGVDIMFYSL